jgi:hypothetical protein
MTEALWLKLSLPEQTLPVNAGEAAGSVTKVLYGTKYNAETRSFCSQLQ